MLSNLLNIYHQLLSRPLFNLLIFLYDIVGDFGIAIIIFTVIVKLFMYPLTKKQLKSQQEMKKIQPKIEELKKKYKGDQQTLIQKQSELYKKEGINPAAGCLPLLVQLPIFIAIFGVLRPGEGQIFTIDGEHLKFSQDALYNFQANIIKDNEVNRYFIGLVDLTKPNLILAALAALGQFFYTKVLSPTGKQKQTREKTKPKDDKEPEMMDLMGQQMKIMNYIFPAMTFFIGMSLPAGLPLYWVTNTIFTLIQHKVGAIDKKNEKPEQ
ncbi:MAG: membrane protein insertase YidC [Candidatus Moranbacteria bacterium]|nr:membrane protein insertase YidC [Candidatus Moranbacteria bacterium]